MVVLGGQNGYYSCEEKCDFDLCKHCVTCPIDGVLLYESYELPGHTETNTINTLSTMTSDNNLETTSFSP